jgi:hypothetical protein
MTSDPGFPTPPRAPRDCRAWGAVAVVCPCTLHLNFVINVHQVQAQLPDHRQPLTRAATVAVRRTTWAQDGPNALIAASRDAIHRRSYRGSHAQQRATTRVPPIWGSRAPLSAQVPHLRGLWLYARSVQAKRRGRYSSQIHTEGGWRMPSGKHGIRCLFRSRPRWRRRFDPETLHVDYICTKCGYAKASIGEGIERFGGGPGPGG